MYIPKHAVQFHVTGLVVDRIMNDYERYLEVALLAIF